MADVHDQALQWAQANSQDPRAQDIMAKAWASKNPDDPRATKILARFQPAIDMAANPRPVSAMTQQQAAQPITAENTVGGITGAVKQANDQLPSVQQQVSDVQSGKLMQDPLMKMAAQAGQGPLANIAGEPLAGLARLVGKGVGTAGDMLMQKAVGLRRYTPGVGQTLANSGVMGTEGMMRGQIESALESKGQELGSLARSVESVPTRPIAERVGERAAKLVGPDGEILPENATEFNKYSKAASDISKDDAISGETAAFRRMQQGRVAKNAGRYRDNPAQGLKAQLAGEQQAAYSEALKNAAPELADVDKSYGHLAAADSAMAKPETLATSSIIGKFLPTSLAESTLGRALMGLGKIPQTSPVQTGLKLAPSALQQMLSTKDSE